jgi:hypothetical protein
MNAKPVVVISSTVWDLSEHRAQAMDACLRLDMHPKMMEHLPALAVGAIRASHGFKAPPPAGARSRRSSVCPVDATIGADQHARSPAASGGSR